MTNPIVSEERAGQINGVEGRFFARTIGGSNYKRGTFTSQTFKATREYEEYGSTLRMIVNLRFDDSCRNGHNTFAITCDIHAKSKNGRWVDYGGGAAHDEIARVFPELAPLIKWHLTSSDSPMHYIANTVYLAGNRDHWGKLKGEARQWETVIQFGDNPIKHKLPGSFVKFLEAAAAHNGRDRFDFEVLAIEHNERGKSGAYQFEPNYTFGGYGDSWHACPFKSESQALDFLKALQTCQPQFVKVATAWGEGKARDLDGARRAAIWPDATDAELSVEPAELRATLEARHGGLMASFRTDIESAGFVWAPAE